MQPSSLVSDTRFTTTDARWHAVLLRDEAADGSFFYGVCTTGIFCRPTCSSKRPLPENVRFFDDQERAVAAGFRPCKRCKPQTAIEDERIAVVAEACRLIDSSPEELNLESLAASVAMSKFHFHRLFKRVTGVTPKVYASRARAERTSASLDTTDAGTVTQAVHEAGYASTSRAYATADEHFGMGLGALRKKGANETIRFATGETDFGTVLVAASEVGVCAVLLGADPTELVRNLERRFAEAELIADDGDFDDWVAHVVGFVQQQHRRFDLPLDIRGTVFQRRVWQALRDVPRGETATYTDIAERIGAPTATRAVAQACGANALAVVIPCHRIVRTDGSLSGYRWGVERKAALLEQEQRTDPRQ